MKKLMYFAAALLVLAGCNTKENAIENAPANMVTITGGIEMNAQSGPRKVVAKDGWETASTVEFVWEEGDEIAVLDADISYGYPTFTGEIKKFTVSKILEGGSIAEFTGEPLSSGMSSYMVMYPYEFGEATIQSANDEWFKNQQYTGKFRPIGFTMGENNSFTLNRLSSMLDLSLKGNAKLGKIEYATANDDASYTTVAAILFGEDGLQLINEPKHVTFAMNLTSNTGFKISFYNIENQLILEKDVTADLLEMNNNTIVSLPTLEVVGATPTVDPKDVFKTGAEIYFKLTFARPQDYEEFNYTNNGSGFTCDKIIESGIDVTSEYASMCPVTLTGDYTFHFELGESFALDYDGANKTYKRSDSNSQYLTIAEFKVNNVSILDQLTDITGQD